MSRPLEATPSADVKILALDLAQATGVAWGPAGQAPEVVKVTLRKKTDDLALGFKNIGYFLRDRFVFPANIPDLIVVEAPLEGGQLGAKQIMSGWGLYAAVEGVAAVYSIPCRAIHASSVRSHLCGRANFGDREATKRAVIQRCRMLKLIPAHCDDDNKADAAALHYYASCKFAGSSREFFLTP